MSALRLRLFAILLACLIIALGLFSFWPASKNSTFEVALVSENTIQDLVPAVGVIGLKKKIDVGAEVSGRIVEIHVDFDEPVSSGQLLAEIDPEPFQASLQDAQARLDVARASKLANDAMLEQINSQIERREGLVEYEAIALEEFESLTFEKKRLQANGLRASAEERAAAAAVDTAKIRLDRTKVYAPIDGFVLEKKIEIGQTINASQTSPVLFVIAENLQNLFIQAKVAEIDIGRVSPDMPVRYTVDAFPDEMFSGVVNEIRTAPVKEGKFVSYLVGVELTGRRDQFLPGMTASLEFVKVEKKNVLTIPIAGLYFKPKNYQPGLTDGERERLAAKMGPLDAELQAIANDAMEMGKFFAEGKRRIFIEIDGEPVARGVKIGAQDNQYAEVVEGDVQRNDRIIVSEVGPS